MKDRVTYASQILYVGPSGVNGSLGETAISGVVPTQLHHIKYIEHSMETENEHVYNYGSREPVGETIVSPIDVGLEFQYNLADAQNEKWLGFNISNFEQPFVSGLLKNENDAQNFYILTVERGDAVTNKTQQEFIKEGNSTVTAFGNGVIESYNIQASVDSIPQATVKVIADNINYNNGVENLPCPNNIDCNTNNKVTLPAPREDNLQVDALRSAYLNLYFSSGEMPQGGYILPSEVPEKSNLKSCSLNSFEINLSLPRKISQGLGHRYAVSKKIEYPTQVEFSCNAATKDIVSGNLLDIFCADGRDLIVSINNPNNGEENINIKLKDIHLDSQVSEHSLMTQEFVNLTFSSPLGRDHDSNVGIYISGVAGVPQETYYGTTTGQLYNGEKAIR